MKTTTQIEKENVDLRLMNERLKRQLVKAIEAFADVAMKLKNATGKAS